jgi:uncharacterized protein DUF551
VSIIDAAKREWNASQPSYSCWDNLSEHDHFLLVAKAAQPVAVPGWKWMPIETAPKDGTLLVLGAKNGVWLGKYRPIYASGFPANNPWSSMLLNHDHMAERYTRPTHWMPLPAAPVNGIGPEQEGGTTQQEAETP